MPRFFTTKENITAAQLRIDSEDAKHISRVLRMQTGDEITVCDGSGNDYKSKISEISENCITCDIIEKTKSITEPQIQITLFQGLPKASKMDYIIQKNTELGIVRIVPLILSRCVVKLDGKSAEAKKTERWQKIANEAAKQSGRGVIPTVMTPMTIDEAIDLSKESDLVFAPYECESDTRLKDIIENEKSVKTISFFIGPEGGFDITEIEKLKAAGIKPVTLGRRILRTETAAEAVVSMLMYAYDEI